MEERHPIDRNDDLWQKCEYIHLLSVEVQPSDIDKTNDSVHLLIRDIFCKVCGYTVINKNRNIIVKIGTMVKRITCIS